MSVVEHLEELRKRLLWSLGAYLVAVLACYAFASDLFGLLKRPLVKAMADYPGSTLAIRSLAEGFLVELKVAAIAGVFVASPVIFYQMWKFVAPGLYDREKKLVLPVVLSSTVLFIGGALFGYFVVFPFVFSFFLSFTGGDTSALLSIGDYLGFAAKLLAAFGIVFELPLIIFILAWLGIVDHEKLRRARRYVVVINFAVAAIITPPDVVSQLFLAIPLIVLYEIGVLVARLVGKRKRRRSHSEDETTADTDENTGETGTSGDGQTGER